MNLPVKNAVPLPTPTPCVTRSMQPHECAEHRKRISFEVKLILMDYWTPDTSPEEQAAKLADWADMLEDWTVDQVRWALIEWRNGEPNRRPNPGHILAMLKKRRGEEYAGRVSALNKPAEPVRELPSLERRAEMLAEYQAALRQLNTMPGE